MIIELAKIELNSEKVRLRWTLVEYRGDGLERDVRFASRFLNSTVSDSVPIIMGVLFSEMNIAGKVIWHFGGTLDGTLEPTVPKCDFSHYSCLGG